MDRELRVSRDGSIQTSSAAPDEIAKVLLLVMPWAPPQFPGLGPALLKSILEKNSVPCDIFYGSLIFSKLTQGDRFVERQLSKVPLCEIVFTPYYYGGDLNAAAEELRKYVLKIAASPDKHTPELYAWVVKQAGLCLDEIFETIEWGHYDIVGFSVMMQQTVSSVALAKRIKSRFPHLKIVFGGPSVSWPMGAELIKNFPEIDFIVEGEADALITPLIEKIRSKATNFETIPSLLYRKPDGSICRTGDGIPFNELDSLPAPDFLPFFHQLENSGLRHVQPYLPFETSRGCWWGQKHHCTFCGIDDNLMKFRTKSPQRVIDEILTLSARHQLTEFFAVDSIINISFFKTLLPIIEKLRIESGLDFTFFFETKSNLRREHVEIFRNGGVNSVQPGIESFSDEVLGLMNKGTTSARQIQCLKLLAEAGIVANWNMIYSNPFETVEAYDEMIAAIPFLYHLPPLHEEGLIPMQINRYAPYHNTPELFGIRNLRPKEHYEKIFPDHRIDFNKLSFYFDYDHDDHANVDLKKGHLALQEAIEHWRDVYRPGSLVQSRGPGFVQIVDRRTVGKGPAEPEIVTLVSPFSEVFSACDELCSESELIQRFSELIAPENIRSLIEDFISKRFIYRSKSGQLINLPLLEGVREHRALGSFLGNWPNFDTEDLPGIDALSTSIASIQSDD
jgi:ribosomal peptide maturation radical SAM protein 1